MRGRVHSVLMDCDLHLFAGVGHASNQAKVRAERAAHELRRPDRVA